jgi:hypothetical protein
LPAARAFLLYFLVLFEELCSLLLLLAGSFQHFFPISTIVKLISGRVAVA